MKCNVMIGIVALMSMLTISAQQQSWKEKYFGWGKKEEKKQPQQQTIEDPRTLAINQAMVEKLITDETVLFNYIQKNETFEKRALALYPSITADIEKLRKQNEQALDMLRDIANQIPKKYISGTLFETGAPIAKRLTQMKSLELHLLDSKLHESLEKAKNISNQQSKIINELNKKQQGQFLTRWAQVIDDNMHIIYTYLSKLSPDVKAALKNARS